MMGQGLPSDTVAKEQSGGTRAATATAAPPARRPGRGVQESEEAAGSGRSVTVFAVVVRSRCERGRGGSTGGRAPASAGPLEPN